MLINPKHAVNVLNRIHEKDPTVLPSLIAYRVPCNEWLADDPTVQVRPSPEGTEVGLLGVLNGIFGVVPFKKHGYIAANYDDEHQLISFSVLGETP